MAKANTEAKTPVAVETPVVETKAKVEQLSTEAVAELIKTHGSVSGMIRFLCASHSRGEVAKMTGKRYQHVRNVMITPIKKAKAPAATA